MTIPEGRIHMVGAGGAGMSAIAKVLVAMGHDLTGSDLRAGGPLDTLADLGIPVHSGHDAAAVAGASVVVVSSAVPDYDEEIRAAHELRIPVWRRPQLLEAITSEMPTIGATGTHGKTTTTALLVTALREIGADPSFIVGGDLVELGTNGHHGETDLLVLEADEAFRTFEQLHLKGLVVTNVEHEHVDHFDSPDDLLDSFTNVARSVDGPVLACIDDPGAARVAADAGALTYGSSADARWRLDEVESGPEGVRFELIGPTGSVRVHLDQPGHHVAQNAAGAIALLVEMGYDLGAVAAGVSTFRGVGRRWEHKGTVGGVVLYDDYAHHPTEVGAVIEAATDITDGRIWAVFQPHLYSRTARFSDEFGEALARADVSVVTDVFGAREAPVPGITGELVAEAVRAAGGVVHYVPHRHDLARFVAPRVKPGDLVLSLGAGDITLLHGELAPMLAVEP